MAMATAPASIAYSSLFSLKTSTANVSSYNNTVPCRRVQVGLRSYQGLSCHVHFRTMFYQQSCKKLQQPHGRIHGVISIGATAEVASDAPPAPPVEISKQKIRIKLKSYWVPRIEQSAKLILDSAKSTGAKALGPIPLPTKHRIYCVLKSPHVHKDAREHFQKKTHQRLIDIENPNAQTIDALMGLDIPEGVDVEVKLK